MPQFKINLVYLAQFEEWKTFSSVFSIVLVVRAVDRSENPGGRSSNQKHFEVESFASIHAKIWGGLNYNAEIGDHFDRK